MIKVVWEIKMRRTFFPGIDTGPLPDYHMILYKKVRRKLNEIHMWD